jgi:hypothetical protein
VGGEIDGSEYGSAKEKEYLDGESKTGHINCEVELFCCPEILHVNAYQIDSARGLQERAECAKGTAGPGSCKRQERIWKVCGKSKGT